MNSILDQDIMFLPGVGPKKKEILSKELGINSYSDLLEYYPYKYVDRSKVFHISELNADMPFVQLKGKILSYDEIDTGKRNKLLVAHFSDGYGVADLIWYRGAQYIMKTYKVGTEYLVFGKPTVFNGRFQFTHPDMDDATNLQISEMGMQPYYSLTENLRKRGYTSRSIEKITKQLVTILPPLPETLPNHIVDRLHLVSRDAAIRMIHYPHSHQEMQKAQVRLKFEELFYVQLNILRYATDQRRKFRGYVFNRIADIFNGFYAHHLPFELTGAQKRVMHEIRADMCSGRQMNRLLQGDVGSGKTLVALMTMLIALDNGYQACSDCNSARKYWHFIKLMGRSASHIALECALQTQPNICLISEEVEAKEMSLDDVVTYIATAVANRAAEGNNFGTVLIPEGLIEFIPAIKKLIAELNEVLTDPATGESREFASAEEQIAFVKGAIAKDNLAVLESLPADVARQLCLDRDPHGNVQVSLIETEKLLSRMVAEKLAAWKKEGKFVGKFSAQHHFFGYEGRCAAPSNYDADYCYSLGFNASRLIANGKTGYMSIIKNTTAPAAEWIAGGVPITMMMNIERRNGANKPVIRKALVELDGAPFKFFASKRDEWAKETAYVYPGPIQYWGPSEVCDQTTKTLQLEQAK